VSEFSIDNLVRNFLKSDINLIRQFFYQTEFKPISKLPFVTSKVIRILNIRHVIQGDTFYKEFVLNQYLTLIRRFHLLKGLLGLSSLRY
jgi:hypothetical protein